MKMFVGVLATAIGVAGYVPYLRDTLKGVTKPHGFSWLVWGILESIAFLAQWSAGAGAGAWVTGLTAVVCFGIAGYAFAKQYHRPHPFDWVALAGALVGMALWQITDNPFLAIISVTIADAFGFAPTFRKEWLHPGEETLIEYALSSLKWIVGLFALESYSVTTWLYPASLVFTNGIFVIMALMRRRSTLRFEAEWDMITDNAAAALKGPNDVVASGPSAYALEVLSVLRSVRFSDQPTLVVLNGPAGAGKSTIGKVLEEMGAQRIPRVTDRPARHDEVNGKDYYFVTPEEFDRLRQEDQIFAAKETYGLHRGFLKSSFANIAAALPGKIFYSEGDSSLSAFKEAQRELGLSAEAVLHIFVIPRSGRDLVRRVQKQHGSGHFDRGEMELRLQEGLRYLRKSSERAKEFPRSIYIVNDDIARMKPVLGALIGMPGHDHAICETDAQGYPVRLSSKPYSHTEGALHPIVVAYLMDASGKLLLQRRRNNDKWDHSAAGHLMPGESVVEAMEREIAEEIGVAVDDLAFRTTTIVDHHLIPRTTRHVFHLFTGRISNPASLVAQSDEVAELAWYESPDLERLLREKPDNFSGGFHATYAWYKEHLKKTDSQA